MKIVKSIEDSGLLLKGVSETIQNEVKEQKEGFLEMLLGILVATSLGNMVTGKGIIGTGNGSKDRQSKKGKGIRRVGHGSKKFLIKDF